MTLKQKIFKALSENSYLSDTQRYKMCGKEPNFNTFCEYERQYHALENQREFYSDKYIVRIEKYRGHKATLDGEHWYKITKEYFEEIKPLFIRDYTRADLKEIETYKRDTSIKL